MKVICIFDEFPEEFKGYHPKVGDIVTVVDERKFDGGLFYALSEYPKLRYHDYWYAAVCFVPLAAAGVDMVSLKVKEEVSLKEVISLYLKKSE